MCENKATVVTNVGDSKVEFITRKIDLVVEEQGFNLKAEGYGEDFLLNIIATLREKNVEAKLVPKPITLTPRAVPSANANTNTPQPIKAVNEAPKPVYSVGEEASSVLAEKFGEKSKELYALSGVVQQPSETDFHHTGIKFDTYNRPKYRCSYECPKCGENGRHYIPMHITKVSCHKCQTPLVVEPATDLGKGTTEEHRDENGNYFFAEVIDYTTASWDKSGK